MTDSAANRLFYVMQSNGPSNSLCRQQHVFPRVQLVGVRVLSVEILAHGFGGKLRLADVPEVPGQVDRFAWGTGGGEVTADGDVVQIKKP